MIASIVVKSKELSKAKVIQFIPLLICKYPKNMERKAHLLSNLAMKEATTYSTEGCILFILLHSWSTTTIFDGACYHIPLP